MSRSGLLMLKQVIQLHTLLDTVKQDNPCSNVGLYLHHCLTTHILLRQVTMKRCYCHYQNIKESNSLEGNWDINDGAAFPEFDRTKHVIDAFEVPESWAKFRACDYGYGSYTGVIWFAVAPDEQLIVYRELYCSKGYSYRSS